jgi:hypothetical protein
MLIANGPSMGTTVNAIPVRLEREKQLNPVRFFGGESPSLAA